MLKIGIGSKNPAKIEAVRLAFEAMKMEIEVVGLEVPSNVSEQPFSDEETIKGAINRAKAVMLEMDKYQLDYGVGLEGGVVETEYGMFVCNWGAISSRDGTIGIGGGHRVELPKNIIELLNNGLELGDAIDRFIGKKDIKKHEGTIGILTSNHITRSNMFKDVVICSFARFLNVDLYEWK